MCKLRHAWWHRACFGVGQYEDRDRTHGLARGGGSRQPVSSTPRADVGLIVVVTPSCHRLDRTCLTWPCIPHLSDTFTLGSLTPSIVLNHWLYSSEYNDNAMRMRIPFSCAGHQSCWKVSESEYPLCYHKGRESQPRGLRMANAGRWKVTTKSVVPRWYEFSYAICPRDNQRDLPLSSCIWRQRPLTLRVIPKGFIHGKGTADEQDTTSVGWVSRIESPKRLARGRWSDSP